MSPRNAIGAHRREEVFSTPYIRPLETSSTHFPAPFDHRSLLPQVNLALSVASTNMVRSDMRGKMAGLYNMTESLGRFLGPAGFATTFAWSIAPSSYDWVDYHFVFLLAAVSMALVAALAWGTITHEHMMTSAERKAAADSTVNRSGGKAQTAVAGPANPADRLL